MKHCSESLRESYESVTHQSGLPIYVFRKPMTSTYALFATRYGGMDLAFRMPGDTAWTKTPEGVAHFLEHKLFDAPDGSDAFAAFSAYGADANAYTTCNRTAYLFSCTDRFADALRELLSFVTAPYFTDATVQKEQGIIAEEIRMYEDNPWERCFQNLMEGMYAAHSLRARICGTVESIKQITPELLYACYNSFYSLPNMALVICGDVTLDEVLRVADEVLPQEPQPMLPIERPVCPEPREVAKPTVNDRMQVSKPLFSIGIKDQNIPTDPGERLRRDAAMSILEEILFSRSGGFYSELFEAGLLTPAYSYGYSISDRFAFHNLAGESDKPQQVLSELQRYLAQVAKQGIDPADFERCRRVLYADELRSYDSTEEIANNLLTFVFDNAELFDYPALLSDIRCEELTPLLQELLNPDLFCLSAVYPLEEEDKNQKENET